MMKGYLRGMKNALMRMQIKLRDVILKMYVLAAKIIGERS